MASRGHVLYISVHQIYCGGVLASPLRGCKARIILDSLLRECCRVRQALFFKLLRVRDSLRRLDMNELLT